MISIRIDEVISNLDILEAYITFRRIEDWCTDHIPKGHWRFDYSSTLCVCGIDIPGRIFFWVEEDAVTFRLTFGSC